MITPQWLLLALGGAIIFSCWLRRNLDAPEDQPYEVRFSNGWRKFMLLCFIACTPLAPLAAYTAEPAAAWYLLSVALLFALLSPMAFLSCIHYGEDGLTIRTYFGVTHELHWEDIISVPAFVADNSKYMTLRTVDKRFILNPNMHGCEEFVLYARERTEEHVAAQQSCTSNE